MLEWRCLPIETDRLIIRRLDENDCCAVYEIFSCAETMRACGMSGIQTIEEAKLLIKRLMETNELAIVHKEKKAVVGTVGFSPYDTVHKRIEMGVELLKEHRKFGYMTEALEPIIEAMFVDGSVHRIEAYTHGGNHASKKLLERMGFKEEGFMKKRNFVHGEYEDCYIYAIINDKTERSARVE